MSLSIGIVGLPNVGKSTLFNALLKKQQALAANYPFATVEPNVGVVPVPDPRLEALAVTVASARKKGEEEISVTIGGKEGEPVVVSPDVGKEALSHDALPPQIPATVEFVDIAGLVAGAHKGEGLGNQFLGHIREVDAIAFVVRAFDDPEVVETGTRELGEDLSTVKMELIMADLTTVTRHKEQATKDRSKEGKQWLEVLEKVEEILNEGVMVSEVTAYHQGDNVGLDSLPTLSKEEIELLRDLHLLSVKPALYVVNVGEVEMSDDREQMTDKRQRYAQNLGVMVKDVVLISAKMEAELAALNEAEQVEYLSQYGLEESGLERLIRAGYEKLDLMSFLTAGEKEVRAWTVPRGTSAVKAAGVIHTDFEKHFIKAEVTNWQKFVEAGGWKRAREQGWVRQEGREYVVQEGDVVEFKVGR